MNLKYAPMIWIIIFLFIITYMPIFVLIAEMLLSVVVSMIKQLWDDILNEI